MNQLEEESENDEEYGAEDIIKQLMQQGFLDREENQAITEESDESFDSIIEQNIQKGIEVGYKGSRLYKS